MRGLEVRIGFAVLCVWTRAILGDEFGEREALFVERASETR